MDSVAVIGATRITIGLSALVKVSPMAFAKGGVIKIFSGGGTLEIIPQPIALSGTSAAGWGNGYPLAAAEVKAIDGPATFYLAATGATMVAAYCVNYSPGATVPV
jgi:hypothetical protein